MTLEEAAQIVGISPTTLKHRIEDRKIEATCGTNGKYSITPEALEKFLAYRKKWPYGHKYEYTDPL